MDLALRIASVAVPTLVIVAGLAILGYGLRLRDRSRQLRKVVGVVLG